MLAVDHFLNKRGFPHGYVLPWQRVLKSSDNLIFSPVGSVSTHTFLAWLYEYNWDVFFSSSGHLVAQEQNILLTIQYLNR